MANSRNRGDSQYTNGQSVNRGDLGTSPRANDFTNPIGSVESYTVYGEGGKARHKGNFYGNNPYLDDLKVANNNEDKDALYERAVEWDADWYNLQEQREYNRGVLEEQREYDSPVNQIARQRAAGLNPDIANGSNGSSIGGSSAQMGQASIADSQGQTKFSNKYDNINNVFNGINTASSLISGLAGGYSSIVAGISQLKTTPSQIALNEANAGLAGANAREVNALLDGKKKSLDLDNISKYMGHVSNLQGLLKNGFTDEEGTNLFNTLGIPAEQQGQLMASIRGVHQNPELLAKFHNDTLNARRAKWNDKVFDDNTVESFTQLAKQIEFDELQFRYADAYLKQSVMNALMYNLDYQNDLVETELNMAATNKVNTDVAYQNAVKDCESWGALWDEKKAVCDGLYSEVAKLKAKAEEDGRWTEEEIGNYTAAWSKFQACKGSLSNEFNSMRAFFIDAMQKRYERNQILTGSGEMRSTDVIGAVNYFSRLNFDSDYDKLPSGGAIAREWLSTAGGFVKDVGFGVGAAAGGIKGFGPRIEQTGHQTIKTTTRGKGTTTTTTDTTYQYGEVPSFSSPYTNKK